MTYRLLALIPALAACLIAGCGQKDTGKTDVKMDAAQVQADDANRIKEIENNPNIPPAQKQAILARIKGREAMSQAGKATSGQK
jgi:hypothetical protein